MTEYKKFLVTAEDIRRFGGKNPHDVNAGVPGNVNAISVQPRRAAYGSLTVRF